MAAISINFNCNKNERKAKLHLKGVLSRLFRHYFKEKQFKLPTTISKTFN
jgi:hypothetical protein